MDFYSVLSRSNQRWAVIIGIALIAGIAIIDALTPNLPLGYLYLFPILVVAAFLPRPWIAFVVLICAALTGLLSHYDLKPAIILFVMAWMGFTGTGFFVSEVVRNRQTAMEHLRELETQTRLRHETEDQLNGLVETSPLAIITIDATGNILLANEAAQSLFAPRDIPITGQPIALFLPALEGVMEQSRSRLFRTQIRCRGRRVNGDVFLAEVWFSTSATAVGPIVSAIIVDFSENLRDREDLKLEHLLKNAKILVGAIAHEIRNLCGAVLVVYKNLSRLQGMRDNEDFRALGMLIEGLENLSIMELRPSWEQGLASVELSSVLDELRVVIEPSYAESGIEIVWQVQEDMPLITGDRYGLLQVFLNLARNSHRAMETCADKRLTISSTVESDSTVIRFEDTGVGIPDPSELFRPFSQKTDATGLGLYISRAILRSFRGELWHEPRSKGCCFGVRLTKFVHMGDSA